MMKDETSEQAEPVDESSAREKMREVWESLRGGEVAEPISTGTIVSMLISTALSAAASPASRACAPDREGNP